MKKYCKIMFLMSFVVLCFQNVFAGNWVQNGDTWMYQNDDGTYVEDQQKFIDGKWYYFGDDKCMLTGLQKIGKEFYYFNNDGTPKTETINYNGKTYNVTEKGRIVGITNAEFEALKDNIFATNAYNAKEQLYPELEKANQYMNSLSLSRHALKECLKKGNYTDDKVDWAINNVKANWKEQAAKCAKEYISISKSLNFTPDRNQYKEILENCVLLSLQYIIVNGDRKQLIDGEEFVANEAAFGVETAYNELGINDPKEKALKYEILILYDKYTHDMVKKSTGKEIIEYNTKGIVNNDNRNVKASKMFNLLTKSAPYLSKKRIQEVMKEFGFINEEIEYAIRENFVAWTNQALRYAKFIYIHDGQNMTKANISSRLYNNGFTDSEVDSAINNLEKSINDNTIGMYSDEELVKDLLEVGFNTYRANILLNNLKIGIVEEEPLQTEEKKELISNNAIDATFLPDSKNQVILNRANEILAITPMSKESIIIKLNNEGYDIEVIRMALSSSVFMWKEYALSIAKELKSQGLLNLQIESELANQHFANSEIEYAMENLQ